MMEEKWYKLIVEYATYFSVNKQDIDDIVSETCVLFCEYPPDYDKLTKSFFYQITHWGRCAFLNKNRRFRNNTVSDEEALLAAVSELNIEREYAEYEIRRKLRYYENSRRFTTKENEMFSEILADTFEYEYSDRTHFDNLKKKLSKLTIKLV